MERLLRVSAALQNPTTGQVAEIKPLEVRKLKVPNLSEAHILKKAIGYRPMRRGSPKLAVGKQDGKVIAHNYGHGGSGWTLAPGSAIYTIDLLEKFSPELKKDTPITIIGAGVIGLFTAYHLIERGYKNLTLVSAAWENLTSHIAGGLFAPISLDNSPEFEKVVEKLGCDTYAFYKLIAEGKNPILKGGAEIIPSYFETRDRSGLESYVGKVLAPAKDVIVDFGNGTQREMVVYDDGIFMHTPRMMEALTLYLKERVKFVTKKVEKFSEISDSYIMNCAGLGSKDLNGDSNLIPVQGHLIHLKNQQPEDLKYMVHVLFNMEVFQNKNGQKLKRSFYFIPKKLLGTADNDMGLIGGTFVEEASDATLNEEEFGHVMKNAKLFYGLE